MTLWLIHFANNSFSLVRILWEASYLPVRFKHEFTNVNIPNNLTLAKPALQNNDGVNGCSLVASIFALKNTRVFQLKRRQGFQPVF